MNPSDLKTFKQDPKSPRLASDHTAILGSEAFLDSGLTDAECDGTDIRRKSHIDAVNKRTEEKLRNANLESDLNSSK